MTIPSHRKRVVIVGGVAGGMSCATRLRRLDENAEIIVLEKGPFVSYANCGIPYALGNVITDEAKLHVQTSEKIKSWFNIDVKTKAEVLEIDRAAKTVTFGDSSEASDRDDEKVRQVSYDKLVLALGAASFRPPVEGINSEHVFTLQTIPDLQNVKAHIAKHGCCNAAVIGGGFIGLEAAENLRLLGLNVTIFEYLPHVFPPIDQDMAEPLHKELQRNGVRLILNARITRIDAASCSAPAAVVLDSSKSIAADIVVVAVGVRARTDVARKAGLEVGKTGLKVNDAMQTSDPDVYAVGDMVETSNLIAHERMQLALAGPANRQGRLVADHICGRKVEFRGNVATAVCKVFDLTVGLVGFSVAGLNRLGLGESMQFVTVHPPDHASYYPGAEPMTVKVAFEIPSGRLLGAQAVGKKGVDKRIDVLAMAIRAGMTIEDLEHVELGYAPPYGSAKDPVNMAGFVGGNVLRRDVEIIHAEDLVNEQMEAERIEPHRATILNKYSILDVRSPDEFKRGHLVGAINLPLGSLRDHMDSLDKKKKIVVYCWVGYRGYLAYRILKQNDFDAVNLDGGFKSVSEGGYEVLRDK
ncbi:uncharacterized protein Z518_06226 [Rhinocladiella mackenziei CBS 650.93]|uniref:Rhodanese domain-containing protein n=1 Tax=Rhinocladiella mackenziei CBS 650.93 TaxID=1442369 RepID=A0A0D2IHU8_9EURO|nr:uncharacterized protein Z518_06226 [Rhinocladiella mackenziei CBS 650.93]KIX05354.1 hypothetical protein Z518_06226 [Rhinocladiella mackenziei CBS 650.93]